MKKIVAVLWHNSANRMRMIRKELNQIADISIFSAGALDDGEEDMDSLYKAIDEADLLLLNETASDMVWKQINEYLTGCTKPMIYIGSEAANYITNSAQAKWSAVCNTYYTYGGTENIMNMIRWICAEVLGEKIYYNKVKKIPWDAIFSPDGKKIYDSPEHYFADFKRSPKGTVALVISRSAWISNDLKVENTLINTLLEEGFTVLPIYTYAMMDKNIGASGVEAALEKFCFFQDGTPCVDGMIRLAGSFYHGECSKVMKKLSCPVIKPICSYNMTMEEWRKNPDGTIADVAWNIALPELDGMIEPVFIGAQEQYGESEYRVPVESRIKKLVRRLAKWINLKKKNNKDKKIIFMLNNNPCTSVEASVGGGANLDTLESIVRVMKAMEEKGYHLENISKTGDELIKTIMARKALSDFRWTTVEEIVRKGGVLAQVSREQYEQWFRELPEDLRCSIEENWGKPVGEGMVKDGKLLITGVQYGNVIVCVQPKRGCMGSKCDGTSCRILHDPHIPPTHQYLATYRWFERIFGADVLIHVGTHGNLEFLPGKSVALSDSCCTDACLGELPLLYIYNADNPPEATIAKRRALAVTIDHMQTNMIQGGLYDKLEEIDEMLNQYQKTKFSDVAQAHLMEHFIYDEIKNNELLSSIDLTDYHDHFDEIVSKCHKILSTVKNTQIQDGMHILGEIPEDEKLIDMIASILRFEGVENQSIRKKICDLLGFDFQTLLNTQGDFYESYEMTGGEILAELDLIVRNIIRLFLSDKEFKDQKEIFRKFSVIDTEYIPEINHFKERVADIASRIYNSREIEALLEGMSGDFIQPGPAGVITRGRDDVLPTGRNMYSLDPEKVPTKAAWEIGKRLGNEVLKKFLKEEGHYPENMALYWMTTDIMWADGEGMAQILYMLGVEPVWLPNGKVHTFKIIPLEELGRPRIDITVKISGILRDNFQNCVAIADDAVRTVASLDEPIDKNFVRKHTLESMREEEMLTFDDAATRIFGAQPGTYTAGVNLMIYSSSWEEQGDIGDLFALYNQYSYGRDRFGKEAIGMLKKNLSTVELTYDKVTSDEHDLLGCCCYFANHGGMTAAAQNFSGKKIKTYYGDSRESTNVEVRTLGEEISRVVNGKLLNPKWIEGQKKAGYQGAGDISKRVGRVYGWDAATNTVDDRIFDNITKTFIANEENREFFMENNPWALEEMSRRLMEAYNRKLWNPQDDLLEEIQNAYLELEGFLEEDMGDQTREFQGSNIEILPGDQMEIFQKNMQKLHGMKKK
ncbi:MAG: cobaltochelatase subunit CobN [Eubacteriales bacterium]|nr:cobaltochelatase subunit CobN [Eubacteriales bacterium]